MWKSYKIAEVRGVTLHLHSSIMIAFLLIGATYLKFPNFGIVASLAISFALTYASVLFHEVGHLIAGHLVGVKIRALSLSLVGGGATCANPNLKLTPGQQAIVAGAGPLVTLMIAVGLYPFVKIDPGSLVSMVTAIVFVTNASLFVANLLPIYPMDGGILLNAAARLVFSDQAAMKINAVSTRLFSALSISLGLYEDRIDIAALGGVSFLFGPWFVRHLMAISTPAKPTDVVISA